MSKGSAGKTRLRTPFGSGRASIVQGISDLRYTLPLVVVAILWEILPTFGIVDALFLPPLHEVLITLWEITLSNELVFETRVSLRRGLIGYFLGIGTAIPIGVLIGWKQTLYDYSELLIDLLRSLPVVALIPVFLLFFGPNEKTILAIIFWPVFFYQLIATIYGTLNVNQTLIDSMRVIGMGERRLFREVFVPGSLPGIFTGLRQTTATMLILTIVAEMLLASEGLGSFIMRTQRNFQVDKTYAGIIMIAILGYAISKSIVVVQRRVLYWSERQTM